MSLASTPVERKPWSAASPNAARPDSPRIASSDHDRTRRFTHVRGRHGDQETIDVLFPDGRTLAGIFFLEEDGRAEARARQIVKALNSLGCDNSTGSSRWLKQGNPIETTGGSRG